MRGVFQAGFFAGVHGSLVTAQREYAKSLHCAIERASPATVLNPLRRARDVVSLSILAIWSTIEFPESGSNRCPFPACLPTARSGDPGQAEGVGDPGKTLPGIRQSPRARGQTKYRKARVCSVNLLISEERREKCRAANFLS